MEKPTPPVPAPRSTKGQFVKGVSGNPKGRAKGSRNNITMMRLETEEALRGLMSPVNAKKILQRAMDIALKGDPDSMATIAMLKLLLDKSMSTLRNEDVGESRDNNVQVNISGLEVAHRDRVPGELPQSGTAPAIVEARVIPSKTQNSN